MKSLTLAAAVAGLMAVLPLTSSAKIERVVEKSFTVSPGGMLHVETQGGNIQVTPGSGDEVKVIARQHFRTNSESEADDVAKNLSLTIEQSASGVTAISKYDGPRLNGFFGGGWPPVNVSFEVVVPTKYNGQLRTSGGNIQVGDLTGDVDARTSGGNVKIGSVDGKVNLHTSGGNIEVVAAMRELDANTSGGHIRIAKVVGNAHVETSGGNISIDDAGGVVNASTSGGNVFARFNSNISGDCSLRTSGGNVTAEVDGKAAFKLDASTSGGSVNASSLTIRLAEGGHGKSKLIGDVNGGGHLLKLRTSGGNVRVASK